MKECNRKLVFVIVLFIIGHTRNRAQSTPEESGKTGFWADNSQHFLQKCNRESRSSVERMADGEQEAQVVYSVRRMEGHVPRSQSEGPSTRPCLSMIANWRQGKPLVFRASAGSMWCTQSVSRLVLMDAEPMLALVVDHEARTCRSLGWGPPKRDLGTIGQQFLSGEGKW